MSERPLLRTQHLQKYFPLKKKSIFQRKIEYVKANKDISLDIFEGETLGLVGESGCGKSTFGRTLIQLYEQTGGVSLYYGETIEELMPQYVGETYRQIPKRFKNYDNDLEKLQQLKLEVDQLDDSVHPKVEEYRLLKSSFEAKYGNILRLAGGLLVSEDLNQVEKLLSKQYLSGSEVAKIQKKIDFEKHRLSLKQQKEITSTKIEQLSSELEVKQKELAEIKSEVESFKNQLRSHPRFEEFETQKDDGIDLSSLTSEEMRKLRSDLQIIYQDP